jgi:hypothetical protein
VRIDLKLAESQKGRMNKHSHGRASYQLIQLYQPLIENNKKKENTGYVRGE